MKKEKELLVAVASQKGGVGKSVFTVLLASVLHYRKGLRVAVVDCDYPQHSIALMRERDMESVMKNDDLKVSLYRQHERIRTSKAIRKRRWRTCVVIWTKRGKLSISCFSTFPERSAARGWSILLLRWTTFSSRSRRTTSSCRVPCSLPRLWKRSWSPGRTAT
jgi:hypothetical protein